MRFIMFLGAVGFVLAEVSSAQAPNAGASFINNLKSTTTDSGWFKSEIQRRDTSVNNGFGLGRTNSPTSAPTPEARQPLRSPATPIAAPVGPPRRQSASFGVGTATSTSKPFSAIETSPTISPYMGLFDEGFGEFNELDYHTMVRPRIQQQQFNQQVVRQAQAINRRVNAIAAQNPYNATGNENMMPTGHAATFQYHSRFYPQKGRQGQRRR